MSGLAGEIKVGDTVKTLHLTRAVYGRVLSISKKKYATVGGRSQPGSPYVKVSGHVENLELITEAELCPEDREPSTLFELKQHQTPEELQEQFNAALDGAGGRQELVSREELARRGEEFREGLRNPILLGTATHHKIDEEE